jgi:hypothetical protein
MTERISIPRDLSGTIPIARIFRLDGSSRTHHPLCPTCPGAPLAENAICGDCIYGIEAERKYRDNNSATETAP